MNHARAALAAFGAGLVTLALPVLADEDLDQIIVTGARAPLSIAAAGSAVTVLGRDDIERFQARYVSDLLHLVPGFAVSQSGVAGTQTQVRVRGAEANHVLVMIDGMRANDPASSDEFRWETLTTANIERIEIVRGPQSAIWGSDSVAGVVNIITRTGRDASPLDAYVETGSDDTLNYSLGGQVGDASLSARASVERVSTDGGNVSRSGEEDDPSETTTATLNALWQAHDALSIKLTARTVDASSQYDAVDPFVTGLPADSDVLLDMHQHHAQLGLELGPAESRIRHQVRAAWFDSENQNFTDGIEGVATLAQRLTFSYQADIRLGEQLLSLALEREASEFQQRGPVDFGDPNQREDMDINSAIIDYRGRLSDSVTWQASARYDENSVFDNALTGRVSTVWTISDDTRLRASAGTGRKNPTFVELFGYFPGQFISNPELKPEKSTSFELGFDRRFGERLDLQVSVFRQDLEDEINGFVFDPTTFLATANNLASDSKRSGAEVALNWSVAETVTINANYTYLDTTEADVREVRRPKHSGSLNVDYLFLEERARIALAAVYGGTRTDTFFRPWPDPPEVVTLANYWLVGLTARYRLSPTVEMFARVSNLLDEQYEHVYGYRTPDRAVFAGIKVALAR